MAEISSAGIALGILTGWSPNVWSVGPRSWRSCSSATRRSASAGRRTLRWSPVHGLGRGAVLLVAHTARGTKSRPPCAGEPVAMTAAEARWLAAAPRDSSPSISSSSGVPVHVLRPTMAATQGYRAGARPVLPSPRVAIALAIKAIGILLMFAWLVISASLGPSRRADSARRWRRDGFRRGRGVSRIWFWYRYDFPSAPMIIAVQGLLLVVGAASARIWSITRI